MFFLSWEYQLSKCCKGLVISNFFEVLQLKFGCKMRRNSLDGLRISGLEVRTIRRLFVNYLFGQQIQWNWKEHF